jgi:2',3'-cyclic-nucleotide 2'-phosphodiesterase (5'-nucleotidase family)
MTHLTILHTNDMHGRVQQVMRIATLAKRIRQEVISSGGQCALWDAGDAEDSILFESSMTKGSAMMAVLRGAGYELEALGNASPLRYGPQCVQDLAEKFGRPLLCANMIDSNTQQLVVGLAPYSVQTMGDTTIGVIGLTDPMRAYSFFKLQVGDPITLLPALIDEVRRQGAQIVILLSHLSSKKDRVVAEQIDGLDLIIGGHDHVRFDPSIVVNRTIIAQAGDYGQWLGRIDLDIDRGQIIQHHGQLIPIDEDIPIDHGTRSAFEAEQERVRHITARVIGIAHEPIEVAYDRECAAGNLLADALLDRMQADVAFVLSGHWNSGLDAGPITVGALFAANRSSANPARARLTGERILHFLCTALLPDNIQKSPQGMRGVPIGMPHVAGLRVRYDPGSLDSIEVMVGSQPLQLDRIYLVAATDMELSDYINYLGVPDDQVEYEVPTIVPEVLQDYIAAHSPLRLPLDRRVTRRSLS